MFETVKAHHNILWFQLGYTPSHWGIGLRQVRIPITDYALSRTNFDEFLGAMLHRRKSIFYTAVLAIFFDPKTAPIFELRANSFRKSRFTGEFEERGLKISFLQLTLIAVWRSEPVPPQIASRNTDVLHL